MSPRVGIVGTGSYLPTAVIGNDEVAAATGVRAEWIETRTGILTRRRAAGHEATSDLALEAARRALESAGIRPQQLGFVVVATSTPDHPQPACASLVQHRLGALGAGAFDVNAVCSGFGYALQVACALLAADDRHRYGLVIGADIYSRIIDPHDRRTAPLFGDGAGAVVIGRVGPDEGIIQHHVVGHGALHDLIKIQAGGSRSPATQETVRSGDHQFRMQGRQVREFVHAHLPDALRTLLEQARCAPEDVQHFVPHQANGQMLAEVQPSLNLPKARVHLTVERYGNTGAASIPVTLDEAQRAGDLPAGELVVLAGFGGGMNIAAQLCRWSI